MDPVGNTTGLSYDANGRPSVVTTPAGGSVSTEYDAAGDPVRRTSATGYVAIIGIGASTWAGIQSCGTRVLTLGLYLDQVHKVRKDRRPQTLKVSVDDEILRVRNRQVGCVAIIHVAGTGK